MSLKSETEELLGWLATLVNQQANPNKSTPTPKETWQSVASYMLGHIGR